MRKMMIEIDGVEVEQASAAYFERQTTTTGKKRLVISIPENQPDLFQKLAARLPAPYYLLYILHTPRGEGEPGRYQSQQLSHEQLKAFLEQYQSYLSDDARFDLWVHSPSADQTLVWDRHNRLFIEGERLELFVEALKSDDFREGTIEPLGNHIHHYREEFDKDAADVLAAFDWSRTPLRSIDEQ
jgi:hypothetical protein